jgi:hypothetical protein
MIWKRKNKNPSLSLDQLENQPGAIGDRLRRAYSQTPVPPDLLARINRAVVAETQQTEAPPPARFQIPTIVLRPVMVGVAAALVAALGVGVARDVPAPSAHPQAAISPNDAPRDDLFTQLAANTKIEAQGAYSPAVGVVVRYRVRPSSRIAHAVVRLRALKVFSDGAMLHPEYCPSSIQTRPEVRGETLCFSNPVVFAKSRALNLHAYAAGIRVISAPATVSLSTVAGRVDQTSAKSTLAPLENHNVAGDGSPIPMPVYPRITLTLDVSRQVVITQVNEAALRKIHVAAGSQR